MGFNIFLLRIFIELIEHLVFLFNIKNFKLVILTISVYLVHYVIVMTWFYMP